MVSFVHLCFALGQQVVEVVHLAGRSDCSNCCVGPAAWRSVSTQDTLGCLSTVNCSLAVSTRAADATAADESRWLRLKTRTSLRQPLRQTSTSCVQLALALLQMNVFSSHVVVTFDLLGIRVPLADDVGLLAAHVVVQHHSGNFVHLPLVHCSTHVPSLLWACS